MVGMELRSWEQSSSQRGIARVTLSHVNADDVSVLETKFQGFSSRWRPRSVSGGDCG